MYPESDVGFVRGGGAAHLTVTAVSTGLREHHMFVEMDKKEPEWQ